MSSATAMKKHAGGVSEYRASEGKSVEIPYRSSYDSLENSYLDRLILFLTFTRRFIDGIEGMGVASSGWVP